MAPLNTEKVWSTLTSDPAFEKKCPPDAREAYRQEVEALPTTLGGGLDAKVTLASLMQAKLDVIERMLESGFVATFVKAALAQVPEDMRPDADEMVAGLKDALATARMPLMEMIHNTTEFLATYGLTERQALSDPKLGLSRANQAAAAAGQLTIRGLLESQPLPILDIGFEVE